jgi:serine/threonine-protein phosphatase 6 regulatory ankyrin repeat subunit B
MSSLEDKKYVSSLYEYVDNPCGYDDLMEAVLSGNLKKVKELLVKGAITNSQDNRGNTPLMLAVKNCDSIKNCYIIVMCLLNYGADPNIRNNDGDTPLYRACESDYTIVKMLFAHGADHNIQNKFGFTALMLAARSGHIDIVIALLEKGVDPKKQNHHGKTALMLAAEFRHSFIVELLLEYGVDPNFQNKDGDTALWCAVASGDRIFGLTSDGYYDTVIALLKKGANPNIIYPWGETALMQAAKSGHLAIVIALLEKGANIITKNRENQTPFDLAMQFGHIQTAKRLRMAMLWSRFRSYARATDRFMQVYREVLHERYRLDGPGYFAALKHFENADANRGSRTPLRSCDEAVPE